MRVKTACDRDDVSFICVAATVRALTAGRIISMAAERVFQDPGSRIQETHLFPSDMGRIGEDSVNRVS